MHTDGKLLLSIRQLTKRYGDKTILESLNLDLHTGEVVVILGPSGSGKSTLLRCVNGLEEKQGGSIVMDGAGEFGKDLPWEAARQKVGMVFQSYELFASCSAPLKPKDAAEPKPKRRPTNCSNASACTSAKPPTRANSPAARSSASPSSAPCA